MTKKRKTKDEKPRRLPMKLRRKFALEDLARAAKGLDPTLIDVLTIVANQLARYKPEKGTTASQLMREGIRMAALGLGCVDPVIREIATRYQAEAEAHGAGATRH